MEAGAVDGDLFARLSAMSDRAVQRHDWTGAVQFLGQAAGLACGRGRMEDAGRYFQESIKLAREHGLEYAELQLRELRYRLLLCSDLTGRVRAELADQLSWSIWPTQLHGSLIEELDRYRTDALSTCDGLIQGGSEALDSLHDALERAREKALAFSLIYLAGQFEDAAVQFRKQRVVDDELRRRIESAAGSARSEILQMCDSMRVRLLLIAAESEHLRGGFDTRNDLLDSAEQDALLLPETLVNVCMARADYSAGDTAIAYARRALDACERLSSVALKGQAAAKLNELLALAKKEERVPAEQLQGAGATDLVAEIVNAFVYPALKENRFEDALNHSERALEVASSPRLRRMVLRARGIALYSLGRFGEAEADTAECISLLSAEISADYHVGTEIFDSRIPEEENFYLIMALLRAKAGDSAGAWRAAEQGRSGRLKRELGEQGDLPADFDLVRSWLHSRRAAIVSFGCTRWGTLVLTAGPDDSEPQAQILDFAYRDLLKQDDLDQDKKILEWIPELSSSLIHPLLPRLLEITKRAQILYIVPDAGLYCAPFAALSVENVTGTRMLIDLCPLAIAPSAAVLVWNSSRPSLSDERDCLAVATGESQGINFCDDLAEVAAARWSKRPTLLAERDATPANVAAEAAQHTVLFFSCHGRMVPGKELMAASELVLEKGTLSAGDVLGWKIHADLVFLSACLAGRFRSEARSDVTGFVKAFMVAGARSVIAPLIRVNPEVAREISAWFFEAWLAGAHKAEALQAAQLKARDRYPNHEWATFWLFWDFL